MKNLFASTLTLSLCMLMTACATNPDSALQAQLAGLPVAVAKDGQSPAETSLEQIRANTAQPTLVPTNKGKEGKFEDYERVLTATRAPAAQNDNAMRSLSYFASLSLLETCNQVCGLKISPEQGVAGQFMTFNCDEKILNIRDYYPGNGKQGFTLSRDRVNLLIEGNPAWLKRNRNSQGEESTFLAWHGADRGFALFAADASDETVNKLVSLAQSIAKVQP